MKSRLIDANGGFAQASSAASAAIRLFGAAAEKFKGVKRTLKPELLYASLIKAGLVKVVRRRGKPPLIVWL